MHIATLTPRKNKTAMPEIIQQRLPQSQQWLHRQEQMTKDNNNNNNNNSSSSNNKIQHAQQYLDQNNTWRTTITDRNHQRRGYNTHNRKTKQHFQKDTKRSKARCNRVLETERTRFHRQPCKDRDPWQRSAAQGCTTNPERAKPSQESEHRVPPSTLNGHKAKQNKQSHSFTGTPLKGEPWQTQWQGWSDHISLSQSNDRVLPQRKNHILAHHGSLKQFGQLSLWKLIDYKHSKEGNQQNFGLLRSAFFCDGITLR